jgi:hypothetical protein
MNRNQRRLTRFAPKKAQETLEEDGTEECDLQE